MEPTNTSRRILPGRDARQSQPRGGVRGQVLGRVDRGVGPALEHRQLHLLDEGSLAPDPVEGELAVAITPVS